MGRDFVCLGAVQTLDQILEGNLKLATQVLRNGDQGNAEILQIYGLDRCKLQDARYDACFMVTDGAADQLFFPQVELLLPLPRSCDRSQQAE